MFRKKAFARQHAEHRALVRKIKFLGVCISALRKVTNHLMVVSARLNNNALCSVIIKKQIMRNGWQPGGHKRPATHMRFTDQYVPSAIKIIHVVIGRDAVFLGPINFKITKWFIIQTTNVG